MAVKLIGPLLIARKLSLKRGARKAKIGQGSIVRSPDPSRKLRGVFSAETELMKAKALANCEIKETKRIKPWGKEKGLMTFLRTL